ncbi:Uncharacterised protein [Mycobacteroides abscessus subsp. massiliense]|nr:Uncharacterised protein [Mycobacteroides abscessus subsp. massiliense]SLA12089.1 Uncharacterised protein [Mycobacteroides abscessus subsp. massiliense]SLA57883.1 Uncharacterised protein [Mycobacteroides abscessus subsp. massiliense]SLA71459.1 Uncharacterised protein [Mycobacteroides abscessus subsp. massiliense]SLA78410.1 Uncharacterised protein [Mycobacteroides abscessus subsp. massiliense]
MRGPQLDGLVIALPRYRRNTEWSGSGQHRPESSLDRGRPMGLWNYQYTHRNSDIRAAKIHRSTHRSDASDRLSRLDRYRPACQRHADGTGHRMPVRIARRLRPSRRERSAPGPAGTQHRRVNPPEEHRHRSWRPTPSAGRFPDRLYHRSRLPGRRSGRKSLPHQSIALIWRQPHSHPTRLQTHRRGIVQTRVLCACGSVPQSFQRVRRRPAPVIKPLRERLGTPGLGAHRGGSRTTAISASTRLTPGRHPQRCRDRVSTRTRTRSSR